MFRPEGWKNPYKKRLTTGLTVKAYEAGADAMLEGLLECEVPCILTNGEGYIGMVLPKVSQEILRALLDMAVKSKEPHWIKYEHLV